jgi:hypothetical protein
VGVVQGGNGVVVATSTLVSRRRAVAAVDIVNNRLSAGRLPEMPSAMANGLVRVAVRLSRVLAEKGVAGSGTAAA